MRNIPTLSALFAAATLVCAAGPAIGQLTPVEPIALPPAVEQGVDMVYIDPEIDVDIRWRNTKLGNVTFARYAGAPLDLIQAINPLYTDLRRGLLAYQRRWSSLPQFRLATGATLSLGRQGERVTRLRERLGLPPGARFDAALSQRLSVFQQVHGLSRTGAADERTIASLNRGALHYEQVLMINMERARRLPGPGELQRHIVVDAGSARVFMYDRGKLVGSMRAVVGSERTQTPMMAAQLRYAAVNPYWNLPPEFGVTLVAPKVLEQGTAYLRDRKYEVFADWYEDSPRLDPDAVDWQAVKDGKLQLRIRRGPGPGNSMGDIKFMMPNKLGIYLHDTHDKTVFTKQNRWVSNGCVRVEDAHRLAVWLFGSMPEARTRGVEERVDLAEAVPVFLTYLTVAAVGDEVTFRTDRYLRDEAVLERYFGPAAGNGSRQPLSEPDMAAP